MFSSKGRLEASSITPEKPASAQRTHSPAVAAWSSMIATGTLERNAASRAAALQYSIIEPTRSGSIAARITGEFSSSATSTAARIIAALETSNIGTA